MAAHRFIQRTEGTESRFDFQPATGNLRFTSDVDASPAWYLSDPAVPALTDRDDASFSVRFRVDDFDDRESPTALVGWMTTQHVGAFGSGLGLLVSVVDRRLVARSIVSAGAHGDSAGDRIGLETGTDYLAVGIYRASDRRLTVDLLSGVGFTSLVGFSSAQVPADHTWNVDRIGLQNEGVRNEDQSAGSITMTVDDLCTPAAVPYTLGLSVQNPRIGEGREGVRREFVSVSLVPASSQPVSVDFVLSSGTAREGRDFSGLRTNLVFSPGQSEIRVPIEILGDLIDEDEETFSALLADPVGARLGDRSQTVITIVDDDEPPVVCVRDASILEGDSGTRAMEFPLTIEGATERTLRLEYETRSGTAGCPVDFECGTNAVALSAARLSTNVLDQTSIAVLVKGDLQEEADETFTVALRSDGNLRLGCPVATGTILDDEDRVFTITGPAPVREGGAGTTTQARFIVRVSRPAGLVPLQVGISALSGSATVNVDVLPVAMNVVFTGSTTEIPVDATILGDDIPESDEEFTLFLRDPVGGRVLPRPGDRATAVILNDDFLPLSRITGSQVRERDNESTNAVVRILLETPAVVDTQVRWYTESVPGGATPEVDYRSATNTFVIPLGELRGPDIQVPVLGDLRDEPDIEVFRVRATVTQGGLSTNLVAEVEIEDNDPAPRVGIRAREPRAPEGDSGIRKAFFDVTLSTPSDLPSQVGYTTINGSATVNEDYRLASGTLRFQPGQISGEIAVDVLGDRTLEADEDFCVVLRDPVRLELQSQASACHTLVNDDDRPEFWVENAVPVREGSPGTVTNALFRVRLSAPSAKPIAFTYSTRDGSASGGIDFRGISVPTTTNLPAGQTEISIPIAVFGDAIDEEDLENFHLDVRLVNPSDAAAGDLEAEGSILDDDSATLRILDAEVLEGDSGLRWARFSVLLSNASAREVSVRGQTRDGTATERDGDYQPTATNLVFTPGQTVAEILVPVVGDLSCETNETFTVELSDPRDATLTDAEGIGTILDDDVSRIALDEVRLVEGDHGTTSNAVFTLRFTPPPKSVLSLPFRTEDGTAHSPEDYSATNGVLVVPPGTTQVSLAIPVQGDNRYEGDETFRLVLGEAECSTQSGGSAVAFILNDDPKLEMTAPLLTAEDCGLGNRAIDPGELVTLSFPLANTGTFNAENVQACLLPDPRISLMGAACADYGNVRGGGAAVFRSFTFRVDGACGERVQAVLSLAEGGVEIGRVTNQFRLGIRPDGTDVCCVPTDLAVTATGNPDPVQVKSNLTYTVLVSNLGPTPVASVMLTNRLGPGFFVTEILSDRGSCGGSESTWICSLGTLAPGESSTVSIRGAPRQPGSLTSLFAVGGSGTDQEPDDNFAVVTTRVNPPDGLSIYPERLRIREGTGRETNAVLQVWLHPPRAARVEVQARTFDGRAVELEDYRPLSPNLVFLGGEQTKTLSVAILGDSLGETDEDLSVVLIEPKGAPIVQPKAEITIEDDDCQRLSITGAEVVEGSPGQNLFAEFAVTLTSPARSNVVFGYATRAISARSTADFSPVQGTNTIPVGADRYIVKVGIVGDTLHEIPDRETFAVTLNPVSGACPGSIEALGTILDDDLPPPRITIGPARVAEGGSGEISYLLFPVQLTGQADNAPRVLYSTRGISATAGEDFAPVTNGVITFDVDGKAFAAVAVYGDSAAEPDETLEVILAGPLHAEIDPNAGSAIGTLINDEYLPKLVGGGLRLREEDCVPANGAIDPLETVKVSLSLTNVGIASTTRLNATLLTAGGGRVRILPITGRQEYGSIPPGGVVARDFEFRVDGNCGDAFQLVLALQDGTFDAGTIVFTNRLGVIRDGVAVCCSEADVAVLGPPESRVEIGAPSTYTLTVTNHGPSEATSVQLRVRLGTGVELVETRTSGSACTLAGDLLTCQAGLIPAGGFERVRLTVIHRTLGAIQTFLALATTTAHDPVSANDSVAVLTDVHPPAGISIEDATVSEGGAPAEARLRVCVEPPPLRGSDVFVDYRTRDGSAMAPGDYASSSKTLRLTSDSPCGFTDGIPVADDNEDEPEEEFFVELFNPIGAALGRHSTGKITLLDNDQPCLSVDDIEVDVGFRGQVRACVPLRLSTPSERDVFVDFRTRDGSAVSGADYAQTNGTVRLPPGTVSACIPVVISGNTTDEGIEHYFLDLSGPTNAVLCDASAVVTITDAIPGRLTVSPVSVFESDTGTNLVFRLTVTRESGTPPSTRMIAYRTVAGAGTAQPNVDYFETNGVVTFPQGVFSSEIHVRVIGDRMWEPDETVELRLENPENLVLEPGGETVWGTLLNDDPIPTLTVREVETLEGNEGLKSLPFTLQLSNPSSETIRFELATFERTARVGEDFIDLRTNLSFLSGETVRTVSVGVRGDTKDEFDEAFVLESKVIGTNAVPSAVLAEATIRNDDDSPILRIDEQISVPEGDSGITNVVFRFSLSEPSGKPVSFRYTTYDDSAIAPRDYTAVSGEVRLQPDQIAAEIPIVVPVNGDTEVEPNETFWLRLSDLLNLRAERDTAKGIIINDDGSGENRPPSVELTSPVGGYPFPRCGSIGLTAQASDPDGPVDRVEFLVVSGPSGARLLGSDRADPFAMDFFDTCEDGDYTFRARAVDPQGLSAISEDVTVRVIGGDIVVIRHPGDCETEILTQHLNPSPGPPPLGFHVLERRLHYILRDPIVHVIERSQMSANLLAAFRVAIWDDPSPAGSATGPCDAEVEALVEAWLRGVGLYLVGDQLSVPGPCLSASVRPLWQRLVGMAPGAGLVEAGEFVRVPTIPDRFNEFFAAGYGDVTDFAYPGTIHPGQWTGDGEVRATLNGAPALIRMPGFEEYDNPFHGRRAIQNVRVTNCGVAGGGAPESDENRKALFRNVVQWLLGGECDAFDASLQIPQRVEGIRGGRLAVDALLGNNGECDGGGAIVSCVLDEGLTVIGAEMIAADGSPIPAEIRIEGQTVAFGVGLIPARSHVTLRTWVEPQAKGEFRWDFVREVNFRDTIMDSLSVDVPDDCALPRLVFLNGRLAAVADCSVPTVLEGSTDLAEWQFVQDVPTFKDSYDIPIEALHETPMRFFRLVVPER
ncbi:MAG: Calx-beta domain-containing protein [Limisphaerales bacterium]